MATPRYQTAGDAFGQPCLLAGALVSIPLRHTSAPPGALRGLPNCLDSAKRRPHFAHLASPPAFWSGRLPSTSPSEGFLAQPDAASAGSAAQRQRAGESARAALDELMEVKAGGGKAGGPLLFPFLFSLAAERPAG